MMHPTDRELMQQALEALTCSGEDDDPGHRCTHCDDYVDRNGPLRAALRERLAKPEREHVTDGQPCWCGPEVTEVDPATGASVVVHKDAIDWEAVAADQALTIALLRTELEEIRYRPIYIADVTMPDPEDSPGYTENEPTNVGCLGVPVNTPVTSPLKRGWVGLTDEEFSFGIQMASNTSWMKAAKWVEAKLREKNT